MNTVSKLIDQINDIKTDGDIIFIAYRSADEQEVTTLVSGKIISLAALVATTLEECKGLKQDLEVANTLLNNLNKKNTY